MYDYLIIGHGIAGAVLAQRLLAKGKTVMVLDTPKANQSSSVAAGIYNPITGRKMSKTWKADLLFPELTAFYQNLEQELDTKFLHPIGMYRPYWTAEDQNDWESRKSDEKFKPYIAETSQTPLAAHPLEDAFGGLHLQQAGYVNVPQLLAANKSYLENKGCYREIMFYESQLKEENRGYCIDDIVANQLIFCNGIQACEGTLFGWLPFTPVKGEILDIKMAKQPEKIYNRGIFMVPTTTGSVRVGSTYKRSYDSVELTEEGKEELKSKLKGLYSGKYEVTSGTSGIRPATKDRKPLIGKHPEKENIYIFNGFGSKGVSFVPYFSKAFVRFLEEGEPLDPEVNIDRCLKYYQK